MSVSVVVGAQWGDEGAGKIVDFLASDVDVVARVAGGANSGQALVHDGETWVAHLIPSGVLHPDKVCVLGDGMVIDPVELQGEIAECRRRGLLPEGSLLVGDGAHVILPYHRLLEEMRESGAEPLGTTRRGIGPCYEAKVGRRGIRIRDLLDRDELALQVARNVEELAPVVEQLGGVAPTDAEIQAWVDTAHRACDSFASCIGDAGAYVARAAEEGRVLLEGAQGALLDIDHGTYPFVTSSSTTAAGACAGIGIGPTLVHRVVGVVKAYCTRAGKGPFPTELDADAARTWREATGEFGATTGRPRRMGWLDLPALRLAARMNGLTEVALTNVDCLSGRGALKLCVAYDLDGARITDFPRDLRSLARATPIFAELSGWDESIENAREPGELPSAVRAYIDAVEGEGGVKISVVSVGSQREQTFRWY